MQAREENSAANAGIRRLARTKFACAIATAACLASCVMVHGYPEEWARLKKTEDNTCPNITGTFKDVGFSTFSTGSCKEGWPCRLSAHFFGGELGGSHVKISQTNDSLLEIQLLRGDQVLKGRFLSAEKNEFVCTPEGLKVTKFEHIYVMAGTNNSYLHRAEDGSLIARLVQAGAGGVVAFPIPAPLPFAFYSGSWIRWIEVPEQTVQD
jgi:hypothetical protein